MFSSILISMFSWMLLCAVRFFLSRARRNKLRLLPGERFAPLRASARFCPHFCFPLSASKKRGATSPGIGRERKPNGALQVLAAIPATRATRAQPRIPRGANKAAAFCATTRNGSLCAHLFIRKVRPKKTFTNAPHGCFCFTNNGYLKSSIQMNHKGAVTHGR